jgi:hypothetical protein
LAAPLLGLAAVSSFSLRGIDVKWVSPLTPLHVAPNGRDSWSGVLAAPNRAGTDGPLASLAGAQAALRARRAGRPCGPARVEVQPGTYFLTDPLVLLPADSDTTFAGVPGETTIISGGQRVDGWREEAPGLWTAALPEARNGVWPLRALYVNGERAILARSPNVGSFFRTVGKAAAAVGPDGKETNAAKKAFRFRSADLRNWPNLGAANAVIFYHWETGMLPLESVDEASQTVTFAGEFKWPFWSNQRYYIENLREALDAPGEWYLDRAGGRLSYRPRRGENMKRATVMAPRLSQLVRFEGEPEAGALVTNVHFENLSFQHTNYVLEAKGHCDWQAADTVNAAIQALGATRCSFTNCELSRLGNYAIWFERGCTDNVVSGCHIHDGSAGGVRLGQGDIPAPPNATSGNRVSDCLIRDLGRDFYGAVPVWIGQSSGNVISHNEICDANYSGISCGWTWGYGPSAAHHNIIEYNYLHHLGRGWLCDLAAIYTLGVQPGTMIRNNLIHDIYDWAEGYGAGGIYPDQGSSQMLIENNVVYRTAGGGFTVHYGKDNICRNNIFAFGRDNQIYLGRRDEDSTLTFDHNLVIFEEGALFSRESELKSFANIYFQAFGEEMTFPLNQTFAQWQASGQDRDSLVADPQFRNPWKDDFRLTPDSPALRLGFKPIDTRTCGITQPAALLKLARGLRRAATAPPRRTQAPPLTLQEGFEKTPLGINADIAITNGEAGTARIRVSDEQAAGGTQSLRFEDAPGLEQSWNPHLWYVPSLVRGTVTCSYDLRLGEGAILRNEWRDAASPYRVGPSLGIDAAGQLTAAKQPLLTLPHDQWVHLEAVCPLGTAATGTWTLSVTLPGQTPQTFAKLPCDPKFREFQWLGFISAATVKTVFYVDNVKLSAPPPK